jgi:hypothetical protein
MHRRSTRLMIRKDQAVRNNDVLSSASRKDHDLGNIFWSQRLAAAVDESRNQQI